MQHFSLSQLVSRIQRSIAINFQESVWVEAEVAQVKQSRGHWYIELAQKEEGKQDIIAQISAVIWKSTAAVIEKKASEKLEILIEEGRQILCEANVEYHAVYGLKLIVRDIDIRFAEGLLARQRAETIAALLKAGLLEKNRSVPMAKVLQRIALISNETAAGYADFMRQLKENSQSYQFRVSLFKAALQGNAARKEIPEQIDAISLNKESFDVVVIIRGGGSKMDLSAFDQLELAQAIGNCPLPVITGIGHETDETVSDMVAALSLKTPTAVAAFLIDRMTQYEIELINRYHLIHRSVINKFQIMDEKLMRNMERLGALMRYRIDKEKTQLLRNWENSIEKANGLISQSQLKLDHVLAIIEAGDPEELLKKGYSILTYNNKPLTDPSLLAENTELVNRIFKGSIRSTFKSYEPKAKR